MIKKQYLLAILLAFAGTMHAKKKHHDHCKNNINTEYVAAVQQSIDVIGTFGLAFSAAIRGGGTPVLVEKVAATLTSPTFYVELVGIGTATDVPTLAALIQGLSSSSALTQVSSAISQS